MAYVAQCFAGFAMPLIAGKSEIIGIRATISDSTKAARLTLIDDPTLDAMVDITGSGTRPRWGKGYGDGARSTPDGSHGIPVLIDIQASANALDGVLRADAMAEPIKVRNGISATNAYNLIGGSITMYIR